MACLWTVKEWGGGAASTAHLHDLDSGPTREFSPTPPPSPLDSSMRRGSPSPEPQPDGESEPPVMVTKVPRAQISIDKKTKVQVRWTNTGGFLRMILRRLQKTFNQPHQINLLVTGILADLIQVDRMSV